MNPETVLYRHSTGPAQHLSLAFFFFFFVHLTFQVYLLLNAYFIMMAYMLSHSNILMLLILIQV